MSQICAQALEVALWRRQHAGRARHRLDDDGGDGRGVVQRDDALEIVRQMRAPFRLACVKACSLAVVGVRQVIDAGEQRAEELAVVDDAADRDAAEADAVIAALAADQARAAALAGDVPVGERDLERGVDRFRARIAEEHVIEVARRQLGDRGDAMAKRRDGRTGRRENNRAPLPVSGSPP